MIRIVSAQPVPCDPCVRGNEHLDALGDGGAVLRGHISDLAPAEQLGIEGRAIPQHTHDELERWRAGLAPELRAAIEALAAGSAPPQGYVPFRA